MFWILNKILKKIYIVFLKSNFIINIVYLIFKNLTNIFIKKIIFKVFKIIVLLDNHFSFFLLLDLLKRILILNRFLINLKLLLELFPI